MRAGVLIGTSLMAFHIHAQEIPIPEGRRLRDIVEEKYPENFYLGASTNLRDQNEGRAVEGIEYEAYEEMAVSVLTAIAREAGESADTERIAVAHRTGELEVGEVSLVIAVGTPHREEAYQASRYIIEEIKKRLPVWKKERFTDGETTWVEGVPPAEGEG